MRDDEIARKLESMSNRWKGYRAELVRHWERAQRHSEKTKEYLKYIKEDEKELKKISKELKKRRG